MSRRVALQALLSLLFQSMALPVVAQIEVRLQKQWEIHLGDTEDASYRTAVCSDGSAHLINSNGRVTSIDSRGRVTRRLSEPRLRGARIAACDAEGGVFVVAFDRPAIRLVRLAASPESRVEEAPLAIRVVDLTFAPGHGLLALAPGDDGILCWLSPSGIASARFGLFQRFGDIASLNIGPVSLVPGTVLWDASKSRVLVFPSYPYEMHAYSVAGQFLGRKVRRGIELRPRVRDSAGTLRESKGLVRAVALLRDEVVAQISRRFPVGPGLERSESLLEVVDYELEHGTRLPLGADGVSGLLQGADRDGALYFQKVQSPVPGSIGVNLVKATLVKRE